MALTEKTCTPCRGGTPPLTKEEAEQYLPQAPGWELQDEATRIKRLYKFKNFAQAMEFANKVGNLAEEEGHHPDITFGWGYCEIVFWTHKIKGLHENDFIMAAKSNQLAESMATT